MHTGSGTKVARSHRDTGPNHRAFLQPSAEVPQCPVSSARGEAVLRAAFEHRSSRATFCLTKRVHRNLSHMRA